ncbi:MULTISPECIES: hypothetical protein [unclassified Nocardiopsis]|uniref:hypothetical protein n=1 Tax=Nocardiopsis TaxID=2013 RepID=UPI00387B0F10
MTAAEEPTPEQLRERLTRREDMAKVREEVAAKRAARRARARADRIKRKATLTGLEARTRYDVYQSGEARAQRVATTRTMALGLLIPVLVAFGAWSAAGVQAGMVTLLGLEEDSPAALAAWLVEPALLGIVAGIIIIRAQLQSAGGDLDERAVRIEFGALATSILLNFAGHWPDELSGAAFAALAGHALGPVGAAGTAYLISLVQDGVTHANPWRLDDGSEAPSLVDHEGSDESDDNTQDTPAAVPVDRSRWAENAFMVPPGTVRLAVVECSRPAPGHTAPDKARSVAEPTTGSGRRSTVEQGEQQGSETPRKERSDKGRKVPKSATPTAAKPSSRELSDADLMAKLDALIGSGDVPEGVSVRRAMGVLGCGYDRAKRVLAARQERKTTVPGQLSVVDALTGEEAA